MFTNTVSDRNLSEIQINCQKSDPYGSLYFSLTILHVLVTVFILINLSSIVIGDRHFWKFFFLKPISLRKQNFQERSN